MNVYMKLYMHMCEMYYTYLCQDVQSANLIHIHGHNLTGKNLCTDKRMRAHMGIPRLTRM
jgi:hypothetical protein